MPKKPTETTTKPPLRALAKAEAIKDKLAGKQVVGFVQFIREQGVMGLAIGLVLGTAVKSVVDSFVANVVQPILGLASGASGTRLDDKFICLKQAADGACINKLTWGTFVGSIISFITIAAIVYFVFKGLRLDRLDKPKDNK